MTVSAAVPSPVVTPVVDYEPPAKSAAGTSRSPAARRVPPRGRHLHAVAGPTPPPGQQQAAAFADAALRTVLEVIDQRRPAAQLPRMLAAGLVDSVLARRSESGASGAAVLRRVHVQATGDGAFEVAASYARGARVHAIACRVQPTPPAARGPGWRVVALHIG